MKFAAIADIHGNHLALEAVLVDIRAQGISDIVNLGDCFSGPLEAGRTADILLRLSLPTVRGNHDRYLIEQPPSAMHLSDRAAFGQLSSAHIDWLKTLPFDAVYRQEVYMCHATPKDDNVYWLEQVLPSGHVCLKDIKQIEAMADGIEQQLILCGHSHIPRIIRLGDGRLIVNPGSVGCPAYDDDAPCPHKVEAGHPMASYAIVEKAEGRWRAAFRTVPYDNIEASALARARGREDWASGLATGWLT